jgi:hypothetical protein
MRNVFQICFAATLYMCAQGACAQAAAGNAAGNGAATKWACWHDGDTALLCQLQSTTLPDVDAPDGDWHYSPQADFVHTVRRAPGSIAGPVVIPMHTHPYERDFMRQLAQSVMCAPRSSCSVTLGSSLDDASAAMLASR